MMEGRINQDNAILRKMEENLRRKGKHLVDVTDQVASSNVGYGQKSIKMGMSGSIHSVIYKL